MKSHVTTNRSRSSSWRSVNAVVYSGLVVIATPWAVRCDSARVKGQNEPDLRNNSRHSSSGIRMRYAIEIIDDGLQMVNFIAFRRNNQDSGNTWSQLSRLLPKPCSVAWTDTGNCSIRDRKLIPSPPHLPRQWPQDPPSVFDPPLERLQRLCLSQPSSPPQSGSMSSSKCTRALLRTRDKLTPSARRLVTKPVLNLGVLVVP
jgi:hypothetical protein